MMAAAAHSLSAAGFDVRASEAGWTAVDPWGTPLRIAAGQLRAARRAT